MRKFLILFLFALLTFNTSFASNIDILPTMQSKSNAQDRVWVGTFQLVWNDLIDRIAFGEIKFPDGTPQIAIELNRQEITTDDLNEKCYYKYLGKVTKNTKSIIKNAIKKKFNETSDIIDKLNLSSKVDSYIIYAMLKKDFKFVNTFDKLGISDFRDSQAEFFGISKNSNNELKSGVKILFYNSPSDYAVLLDTIGKDEVYLYKTPNTKPFNYIYYDMNKKRLAYNGNTNLSNQDELKVPNLKFFEEKTFDELSGKRIKGTKLQIDKAIETIKFDMNREGVKLKSEAAITMMKTSLEPEFHEQPKYLYFDDTFVLFIKEKEKTNPYFALRIHNIDNFQN